MLHIRLTRLTSLGVVLAMLAPAAGAHAGRARSTVAVSFLRGEHLVKIHRPGRTPADAVRQLIFGLTAAETRDGFRTYLMPSTKLRSLTVRDRLATIDLSAAFGLGRDAPLLARVAQVVQTLSAFRSVTRVLFLVEGKRIALLLAFQKFQRLGRTSALDTATKTALATATRPLPVTIAGSCKRAQVLLDRQVALLINNNRVVRAIAVSTGKPSTPTPPGSYHVYAKIPRWWSTPFHKWLPWAIPFVGGIAFHEFPEVPAYPASHGCVRQSFAVARWTFDFAKVGMPVRVIARS